MKSFAAIAFAAVASALPALQPRDAPQPLIFGGLALRSGSPIHLGSINANGQSFWIGRDTATSCPAEAGDVCKTANTKDTVFVYSNGDNKGSLNVIVPGGQAIYVTQGADGVNAGQLKFTPAHSASTAGPALFDGFAVAADSKFQFEGKDWLACPVDSRSYQIYAESRGANGNGGVCLPFTFHVAQLANDYSKAWQYE